MSAFTALLKAVQADLLDVPGPLVYAAIVRTARDLCDKTGCWLGDVQTVSMADGMSSIAMTIPDGAEFVSVQYLTLDGVPLDPTTERELEKYEWDWRSMKGDPTCFISDASSKTLTLCPAPNRAKIDAFKYQIQLKPRADATSVPEFMCEQFAETLQYGAAYELLKMPRRPWTDPNLATFNRRMYRNGVYEARGKVLRAFASQSLNILPETLA